MTTNSREHILARLRKQLARTAEETLHAQHAINTKLTEHATGPRPLRYSNEDQLTEAQALLDRFCEKSALLSSSNAHIDSLAAAPQAIANYLQAQQLPTRGVCWPELAALDWRGAGLDLQSRPATGDDLLGITGCFCALAETGTLLLCSGDTTPAATSLLPETHIAILPAQRIVADMEAAWQLVRSKLGTIPRAMNFISGPSRTGDIEQTIVLGAHGPYRVHILIVHN